MRRFLVIALLALSFSALPAQAAKILDDPEKGLLLNIGLLLQPQAQFTIDGAPSGKLATDFFLRRARILAYGTLTKRIGFFLETDQPNWGKKADFTLPFYVQDAWVWFDLGFSSPTFIDAGMIILPFSHQGVQSAASLNTLDYHSGLIKYGAANVFREMGVQLRGFLLDKAIHYRVGIFNGTEGKADTVTSGVVTAAGVNPKDVPLFIGQARYNIAGVEEGFFWSGVTFSDKPVINVGVSGYYQANSGASSVAGTPPAAVYNSNSGLNADVFAEIPLDGGLSLVSQGSFYLYGNGAGAKTTGKGFFIEGGCLVQSLALELVAGFDYFDSDEAAAKTGDLRKWTGGVNWFFNKHATNLKLEVSGTRAGDPGSAKNVKAVTLQTQLFF